MPSDQHIRRLARELVLPEEADLVIQKPKYWDPAFCWLYFRLCDDLILEVPADGLAAAEVGPELVYLTRTITRKPQDRLMLRALAVLGSAYRGTDDLNQADKRYDHAFKLLRDNPAIPPSDGANLLFRLAVLRSCQNRYSQATKLADRSVNIYRDSPDHIQRRHLGEALTVRGYIHHMHGELALAMKDWGEAVPRTDVKLTPRIFYAGVHNLALGMIESVVPPRDLSTIEKYMTQASRHFSSKPLSVPKLKISWVRSMIMMRFGSTRRGEATYRKVIAGFLKLGNIVDMALVSVTLARHFQSELRFEELKKIAAETNDVCERLCKNEDVKRAVFIWKETVLANTVSTEVFSTTLRILERNSFATTARVTTVSGSTSTLKIDSATPNKGASHGER